MPEPGDEEFWNQFDTHEMLMEATVWVLAEEGYRGLTLRKVAERAGKNRGLVHYYFDSKADLLESLLDHVLEGMERLLQIDEDDTPSEKLWTALEFLAYGPGGIEEHGRHYYVAIFQLQALAAHDPELGERFTRNYTYMVDLVAGILAEGIEAGAYRDVDPQRTAEFLVAAVEGARNVDLSLDVDSSREHVLETIGELESELLVDPGAD